MTKLRRETSLRRRGTKRDPNMFSQATIITIIGRAFIKIELEICRGFGEDGGAGVAETLVPQVGGDGGGETVARRCEGVELAGRITS